MIDICYDWPYFWTIWKRCAMHGEILHRHSYLDHLELFEYDDKKVRRL